MLAFVQGSGGIHAVSLLLPHFCRHGVLSPGFLSNPGCLFGVVCYPIYRWQASVGCCRLATRPPLCYAVGRFRKQPWDACGRLDRIGSL